MNDLETRLPGLLDEMPPMPDTLRAQVVDGALAALAPATGGRRRRGLRVVFAAAGVVGLAALFGLFAVLIVQTPDKTTPAAAAPGIAVVMSVDQPNGAVGGRDLTEAFARIVSRRARVDGIPGVSVEATHPGQVRMFVKGAEALNQVFALTQPASGGVYDLGAARATGRTLGSLEAAIRRLPSKGSGTYYLVDDRDGSRRAGPAPTLQALLRQAGGRRVHWHHVMVPAGYLVLKKTTFAPGRGTQTLYLLRDDPLVRADEIISARRDYSAAPHTNIQSARVQISPAARARLNAVHTRGPLVLAVNGQAAFPVIAVSTATPTLRVALAWEGGGATAVIDPLRAGGLDARVKVTSSERTGENHRLGQKVTPSPEIRRELARSAHAVGGPLGGVNPASYLQVAHLTRRGRDITLGTALNGRGEEVQFLQGAGLLQVGQCLPDLHRPALALCAFGGTPGTTGARLLWGRATPDATVTVARRGAPPITTTTPTGWFLLPIPKNGPPPARVTVTSPDGTIIATATPRTDELLAIANR